MLKHPEITRRRIASFLEHELRGRIVAATEELQVEYHSEPATTAAEAAKGKWQKAEKGFRYGPAYTTFWFRVKGKVPASMEGLDIAIRPDIGGERTLWKDGRPYLGVDGEHALIAWDAKDPIDLIFQVYTTNPQHRVHLKELPREQEVETMKCAEIVGLRPKYQDLIYDFEFYSSLLDGIESTNPVYATMLRALNEAINVFQGDQPDTIDRGRRIIREAAATLNDEFKHTTFAVGHSHLDTAWLWPIHITMKKMAHTTATQLRMMEKYPEYVFAHSQASQYEWLELQYPKLFQEVKEATARGQWEPVGSMWVEADCNLTGGESLVRQFLYGKRYFREKLGVETKDMWLPDVFGYSAALPQILQKFNITTFLTQKISWNQVNRFPHNTFWWKGIDGSKIWSHFPPADTYIGTCEPKELINSVKRHQDQARSDYSLYLYGWGDGGGGPTERHLELLRRARQAPSYPVVVTGRKASDFFSEARARSKDLATWSGELYLEFHRGTYTTQAANKKFNRQSEFLMRDAELLACFAGNYQKDYPAKKLEDAWKLVLLNQFHDIIPGSSVREVYEDSDKDYAEVLKAGNDVVDQALEQIGSQLSTEGMSKPIALFQNASMYCQGSIPWSDEEIPGALVTADESLPVQLVDEFGEKKLIFQTPSAALGTVAVADLVHDGQPSRSRLKASARKIENDEVAVRFDGNGNITSIQSLEDGTEFIEPGKLGNLFQLFDDKPLFWSAWDIDIFAFEKGIDLVKSESFEIIERGPVRTAVQIEKKFSKSTIRQIISLGPTPGIRFDTEVDWHEEDKLLKVGFPINVNATRATHEIQFGSIERPTHSNTTWDLAKFETCAQKWVDVSEGDMGAALLNDCKYGHDVKGSLIRLSLLRAPKAPDPIADMGLHKFTYCLLPHFGNHVMAGVVQAAYALNAPVRHKYLGQHKGADLLLPQLVGCENRNLVVEAVKRSEDGKDLIVRVYECHNTRGQAELTCARSIKSAALCDLEEQPVGDLEMHEGAVRFEYKPFEILTIRLRV